MDLGSVSCVSAGDCYAVSSYFPSASAGGTEALALQYQGSQWVQMPTVSGTGDWGLNGVSCFSNGSCQSVGANPPVTSPVPRRCLSP